MTARISQADFEAQVRRNLLPEHGFVLHLIDADGTVLFASGEHTRAYCLAMVDTLCWIFDDANGWELVCLATGEPVMAGVRGEVPHAPTS